MNRSLIARSSAGPLWVLLAGLLLAAGCDSSPDSASAPSEDSKQELIVTTSHELSAFVRDLVGDQVAIQTVRPVGDHSNLTDSDFDALQNATLIVRTDEASWLNTVTISRRRIHNVDDAVRDQLLAEDSAIVHQHGPSGEQSNRTGLPGAMWSPTLLKTSAITLAGVLADDFPKLLEGMPDKEREFHKRIRALDDAADLLKNASFETNDPRAQYLLSSFDCSVTRNEELAEYEVRIQAEGETAVWKLTPCEESATASFAACLEVNVQALKAALK